MIRTLLSALTLGVLLGASALELPTWASLAPEANPTAPELAASPGVHAVQAVQAAQAPAADATEEPSALVVMTYNLRYASDAEPNSWGARLPVALELIRAEAPDVIGTQEGLWRQIRDLEDGLPDYAWVGLGREGGSHGEFGAIFYRRARFEVLEFDHFWLSDTPDRIGSTSWGNGVVRMVTWVRFRDRRTASEFVVYNTHFDHQVQASREKSAALLLARSQKHFAQLPVLITGDFNAVGGANPAYSTLVGAGRFHDAWSTALERGPEVSTFHGYTDPAAGRGRIDWILYDDDWKTLSAHVATYAKDGQFPSDHFPVVATFELAVR